MKNKILIVFLALYFFVPYETHAATLSISPSASNVFVGNTFIVKINVNTLSKSINNAEGIIQFPADMLEVLSMNKISSIFYLWVEEPSFSNSTGKITFNGGVPDPGFVGQNGNILSITFKAKKQGTASVVFTSGIVRENDGLGTDIINKLTGATFYIKKAVTPITPTPIPTPVLTPVPEVLQPLPIPKAPEIMASIKDGVTSIVGSSGYPQAQVFITFVSQEGIKILVLGVADINGNFNILVPNSLKPDSYAVIATMTKEDKTNSEASNAIIVKIGNMIFNIAWEMWLFIIIMIILILDLITHIYFRFKKNRYVNKLIKNKLDLDEAENVVHQSFNFLRNDLVNRAGGIVNSVDRVNVEELQKDIDSTEKVITKKIKDME